MKVFPYALIRLAGMPFPNTSAPLAKALEEVEMKEKTLKVTKATLLQELAEIQNVCKENFQKQVCLNLTRDLRQDRSIKIKSRFEFLFPAKRSLANWKTAKSAFEKALVDLELAFQESLFSFRAVLKSQLQYGAIEDGIQLSSKSAYKRLLSYLEAPNEKVNKKLRQAELTGLKYFTRASTKTSPFAGFGPLAWVGDFEHEAQMNCKVNQVLLIFLEEYILSKKELSENLDYQINPSIWRSGEAINFLVNHRNVEEIKVLPTQALLDHLLSQHSEDQQPMEAWLTQLKTSLEVDPAALETFLENLVEEGFFIPVFPCEREDSNWMKIWLEFAAKRFSTQKELIELLQLTNDLEHWSTAELSNVNQAWKTIIGDQFNLDLEKFYYRDDYLALESGEEQPGVSKLFSDQLTFINKYVPRLQSINFSKQKEAIKKVFTALNIDQIGLLDFYKIFHQANPIELEQELRDHEQKLIHFDKLVSSIFSPKKLKNRHQETIINITTEQLEQLFPSTHPSISAYWYGAIFQKGSGLPFLRNVFIGHGKMMSRFINNPVVSEKILASNQADENNLYVDHSDSSAFNANLHPTLTGQKIAPINGASNDLGRSLSLTDLYLSNEDGKIVLRSKNETKRIVPINYGLEGIDRRSPLYQLIQGFGTEVPDFNIFLQRLNPIVKKEADWGVFLPMIQLNNLVVIQRKQWHINLDSFPKYEPGQIDASFTYQLHQFLQSLDAPIVGYLRQKLKNNSTKRNSHKPQYFNFSEPAYVSLLKQMLKDWNSDFIWEACYPAPSQTAPFAGQSQEWVVEWLP